MTNQREIELSTSAFCDADAKEQDSPELKSHPDTIKRIDLRIFDQRNYAHYLS
jgi:hypothetical protein